MRERCRRILVLVGTALLIPACGDRGSGSGGSTLDTAEGDASTLGSGQAPFVRIINPGPRSTCKKGSTVNIQAVAVDPDADIIRVDFYVGNKMIGRRLAPPFILPWGGVPEGTHVLTVIAFDVQGLTSVSHPVILISVDDDGDDDDRDGDDDEDDRGGRHGRR